MHPDSIYGVIDQSRQDLLPAVQDAFVRLRESALVEGIGLEIISAYRGFDRQLLIWNRKATGKLAVLDDEGAPVALERMSLREQVFAILRWSALPGSSRHHWRTDVDVYDALAAPDGYQVRLTGRESREVFGHLHQWLDQKIAAGDAEGFFRPFREDLGGVAPELWHLSHAETARPCAQGFSLERWRELLQLADLALKETVLEHLEEIFQRFVLPH